MVNVRKRGKVFQYQFEIAPVDGIRKYINKSGFKTKAEAEKAGVIAYNEYTQTGHSFTPNTMSYSDYLDYWLREHYILYIPKVICLSNRLNINNTINIIYIDNIQGARTCGSGKKYKNCCGKNA